MFNSELLVKCLLSEPLARFFGFLALSEQVLLFLLELSLSLIKAGFVQIKLQITLEGKSVVYIEHLELEEGTHTQFLVTIQQVLHREMILVPFVMILRISRSHTR